MARDAEGWFVTDPPQATTCAAVAPGWECPWWGRSCRKQCGNGAVNRAATAAAPNDRGPNLALAEQCDMGDFNAP